MSGGSVNRSALVGTIFGKLTVTAELAGSRRRCRCECGRESVVKTCNLTKPNGTRSCGCLRWKPTPEQIERRRATMLRNGKKRIKCLWSRSWMLGAAKRFTTGKAIARHVGCEKSAVYQALDRYGIVLEGIPRTNRHTIRTKKTALAMCRTGMTARSVGRKLKVDESLVSKWARTEGISADRNLGFKRTRNSELYPHGRWRTAMIRRAVEMSVIEKKGRTRIARALEIGQATVQKMLQTPYADALRVYVFGDGGGLGSGATKPRHANAMHHQGCNVELIARTIDATVDEVREWVGG